MIEVETEIWQAVWLRVRLAGITTLLLLVVCCPLSWWLSRNDFRGKGVVEAIISLPLVLPPSVLGFYLLIALSPSGWLGRLSDWLGGPSLAFSFWGLVIGSMVYSLPFVAQPLQAAFRLVRKEHWEAAATLGSGPWNAFFTVALPLARRGVVTAAALGFAHTVGEFGVVLMIGGSIPGETQVLSVAIFERVEMLRYDEAHLMAGGLLLFSLLLLGLVYGLNRRIGMLGS